MLPCPSCDRHVRGDERACPFCGSVLRATRVRSIPRAAIVIAVGSALAGCGPGVSDAGDSIGGSGSDGGTGQPGGTLGGDEGSTSTTGIPGTTDPTMAMSTSTSLGDTSTGGSTTFVEETGDAVGGFYGGAPDVGYMPYECDVFTQDCPDGEKCMPWANDGGDIWNASRCTPLEPGGGDAPGAACQVEASGVSGIDTCAAGGMCFYVDPETNEGVCVQTCSGTAEDPLCLEGTCVVQFDGALPLCFVTCDPVDPACEKTEVCEPVLDKTIETEVCVPT